LTLDATSGAWRQRPRTTPAISNDVNAAAFVDAFQQWSAFALLAQEGGF
jgi:hypothetical protein